MIDNRLRDSAYGRVIHEDVSLENMPKDAELLMRSAKAYWDGTVYGAYENNIIGSRIMSAILCEKLCETGAAARFPESNARVAALKYYQDDFEHARIYMERWCEHIHLTADICSLSMEFYFYLDELGGSCEKILNWCRSRAEQDRSRNDTPTGIVLLRHFLIIQSMLSERKTGEKADDFWSRMYRLYRVLPITLHQLIAARWERCSLSAQFSGEETPSPSNWEISTTRARANKGNMIALSYVLSKEWQWDSDETLAEWRSKWDEERAKICDEQASFGVDWFEKEKEKAADTGREIHDRGAIRREGRGIYMAGLARYALADRDRAIEMMRLACEKHSYEAMGWLERHGIDFEGENYIKPYPDMMEMEVLADELHAKPNAEGLQILAAKLEQGGELFSAQPEAASALYAKANQFRADAEILERVLACGRAEALAKAEQLLEAIPERPEMADQLRRFSLMLRMHIAKIDGSLLIREPLDFIAVDLDDSPELRPLIAGAAEEDWDALYKLCMHYIKDSRIRNNPYLASVSYHLGRRICEMYRDIYFRIEDESARMDVLRDWLRISLLMDNGDNGAEVMRIGLYQEEPYFCSLLVNEDIAASLDLDNSQVIEYLQTAQAHGYDVSGELDKRIGDRKEVFTADYFETRRRKRLEDRAQSRNWMADIEQLLCEGAENVSEKAAPLRRKAGSEPECQSAFKTFEWEN